ncbi:C-type lectin domain family 4 member M-like [Boleophthalmus pectinirostris]|uniref:C-type lectin domain family 4 member M-like n=1 Tax=Boleophthalmus pectinirostris TaxID=150288 RepID=UPI00242DE364|nr:C-type lectin domain family 4 member M-like [Boleophthalmus pectinirostris]
MDIYENTLECVQKDKRSLRTTFRQTRGSIETTDQEEEAGSWIKGNTDAADTGGRVMKLVILGFGVLCILQASLNVALRLGQSCINLSEEINEQQKIYSILNMSHHNLSEERDELHKMYSILMAEKKNLLEEKEELQTINSFLNTSHQNLSEERDELQRLYSVLNMSHHNLSEERDELQKMYSILMAEKKSLLEEKDELQTINSFLNTSHQNLSEERDELQRLYSALQARYNNVDEEKNKILAKLQKLNNNWLYFSGSFYHCSDNKRSWEDSRSFCQEQGGDLVVINNEEEQNFLRVYGGRRWIGLSDRQTEGVWKWVDGSSLTLSSWLSGEPNDGNGNEDCGEILMRDNGDWKLNDLSCNNEQSCICEM